MKKTRESGPQSSIPYFAQWESPDLVSEFITKSRKSQSDPRWKESGAESKNEYAFWSPNICGMACLKMILAEVTGIAYPLIVLAKQAAEYGAYIPSRTDVLGLYYAPFCDFINKEFCLSAWYSSNLSISQIEREVEKGSYVIASVHSSIRTPKSSPPSKGGHLVLIISVDRKKITKLLFIILQD
ncbi:MAG: hypothetical protein COY80_00235 [Candidatus Pacebacteria bacterium CG_4_10_14_0_8_um_filter_42_14]|nr:MAG: hypothetical protein COY80_00235 [Candidatus Pacebacteria bacterium CG_4_10_14_0_8_um_filter_42_14]